MIAVGSRGVYEWLVTDQEFDLLQVSPEGVLGKYIAVTSIDSGPLVLSDKEKTAGWASREQIAYSPKIESVEGLPRAGWDEWYIFGSPTDLGISHLAENIFEVPQEQGHLSVLVNYGLALHRPEDALIALFWQQIERLRPESYMADHDYLIFVSLNKTLFARVHEAVKAIS